MGYWRKILKNANLDPDVIELKARDRKTFAKALRKREKHLELWEESKAARNEIEKSERTRTTELKCEECGKECATVGGLKSHITKMHGQGKLKEFKCMECGTNFTTKASLVNHQKRCQGAAPGICPHCNREQAGRNLARHVGRCRQKREGVAQGGGGYGSASAEPARMEI